MSTPSRPDGPGPDPSTDSSEEDLSCTACGADLKVHGAFCPECGAWSSDRIAPTGK